MQNKRFLLLCAALLFGSAPLPSRSASPRVPVVEKLAETRHPSPREIAGRLASVVLVHFDAENRLQRSEPRIAENGACEGGLFPQAGGWSPRCQRTLLLPAPRVESCRCEGPLPDGQPGLGIAHLGIGPQGREVWRRLQRSPQQASHRDPSLVSASPGGLVFSDLEIRAPASGETLRPRDASGFEVFHSAHYLPDQDAFLFFRADVTLVRREGGLYLYRPATGQQELVLPVDARLLGHYVIDDMAALPGGRWLVLGERYATRGPDQARFRVFDLQTRRIVYSEKFESEQGTSEVRVAVGAEGHAAFAFIEHRSASEVVVHYRIAAPQPGRRADAR